MRGQRGGIENMVLNLPDFVSVKEAAELMKVSQNTVYAYLNKNAIVDAYRFAGTRWMVPIKWINEYLAGKITLKGVFKSDYAKRKARKRSRKEMPQNDS